jgi:hypothetical protein
MAFFSSFMRDPLVGDEAILIWDDRSSPRLVSDHFLGRLDGRLAHAFARVVVAAEQRKGGSLPPKGSFTRGPVVRRWT